MSLEKVMTTTLRALTLALLLSLATPAAADWLDDGGRIAIALEAGTIDETEALFLAYLQHFEPDALPAEYTGEWTEGWRCSTGLVMQLRDQWSRFTPERRERMTSHIAPFKTDLLDVPTEIEARPDDTCWGQYGDNRILGEHFSVEWDHGTISEETANDFLDALEYSWEVEVDELGWRQPDGTDDYLMLIYVAEGNYASAYTTVDHCGGEYLPYVVAYEGSFAPGSNWYQDMACHEFNHAMQFAYGFAHEFWWWEATATYIEEAVYPSHNGWAPYISGYSGAPWLAMNASSQEDYEIFMHMYGMSIMGFFLEQYVGDADLVRQTWSESSSYGGQYNLYLPDLLEDMGYDFYAAYPSFMAANTVMAYEDQSAFPDITVQNMVYSLPDDGGNGYGTTPETLGQNYIRFDTGEATDALPDLLVTFEGQAGGDWIALLVGTDGDEVTETVSIELTDDAGEGRLADFGQYDRAWLVVSPTRQSDNAYDYSWSAELVEADPEAGDDDDDDDATDDDDDDLQAMGDDDGTLVVGADCTCRQAAGPRGPTAALTLLAALLLRLRRR
jgi:hypothetical protein